LQNLWWDVCVFAQPEEYKHHIWDVNKLSMDISITTSQSEVTNDLNDLFGYLEDMVNSLEDGELHIYTGEIGEYDYEDVIYIAGFYKIKKDLKVDSGFYLTLDSIAEWADGEDLMITPEIADELEFTIPEESVFTMTQGMYSWSDIYLDALGDVDIVSDLSFATESYKRYILNTLSNIYDIIVSRVKQYEEFYYTSPTVPLPLDEFVPGYPLGDPSVIQAVGPEWESLSYEVPGISFNYEQSGNTARFTAKGSISVPGASFEIDFSAEYDLSNGLLKKLKLDYSVSGISDTMYTYKYGDVDCTLDFSINFDISYGSSESIEQWTEFGEPLAYKITTFELSPELKDILQDALEENVSIPGDTIFEDDVESGADGWIASGGWHINSTLYYSESHSWYTGHYDNDVEWILESPPINVSGYSAVLLSFWAWYDIEYSYDECVVEYSTDGGLNWEWLDYITGSSYGYWEHFSYTIYLYGEDQLLIRFRLTTDSSVTDQGIAIDDISIMSMREIGVMDVLMNARGVFTYDSNPTGLDPTYSAVSYYVDPDTEDMIALDAGYTVQNMLTAGSLRVIPDKDILYGQMQLEGAILADVLPGFIDYILYVIEQEEGITVPTIDVSGEFGVFESTQGHFALLSNISYSVDYPNPPSEYDIPPFTISGSCGVWYVYKEEGYLVETGFEFKLKGKIDTNGDGSLSDEVEHEYSFKIIINKVVSEKVSTTGFGTSGWVIHWDQLDSDPPAFNTGEWSDVTPYKKAGGIKEMLTSYAIIGIAVVVIVVIAAIALLRRRPAEEY